MYLSSLRLMLPHFASTGHDKYLKSVRWFLEEMEEIPADVLEQFKRGEFVVRRSDGCYTGMSGDYTIETTLMASFKGKTGQYHYEAVCHIKTEPFPDLVFKIIY